MLYVIKNGKQIFADKTLVGTPRYATPVFTADMKTIVFNPDWIAPETVVTEDLAPQLRRGNYSILRAHKLQANYQGKPIDPARVDWGRVNVHAYSLAVGMDVDARPINSRRVNRLALIVYLEFVCP